MTPATPHQLIAKIQALLAAPKGTAGVEWDVLQAQIDLGLESEFGAIFTLDDWSEEEKD